MAEIHVGPRRKSRGWLWLLLLLVVVAAVVYFLYVNGTLNFAHAADTAAGRLVAVAHATPGGIHGPT